MEDIGTIILTVAGWVLIIVSVLALAANLVADAIKLFKREDDIGTTATIGDIIAKLPERYLIPVVTLLLGVFLAAPDQFADLVDRAFPSDGGGGENGGDAE